MPDEGSERMTEEFAYQLHIIEDILSDIMDCHVIVGGDFNVDLSRAWVHTALLDSFCSNIDLHYALRHDNNVRLIILTILIHVALACLITFCCQEHYSMNLLITFQFNIVSIIYVITNLSFHN